MNHFISATPEYLQEEVWSRFGVVVPLETVITYLDSDPYLTPETLFDYISKDNTLTPQNNQIMEKAIKLKGYTFIEFGVNDNEILATPGVYIWILKDGAVLPDINGVSPSFKTVEAAGKEYRVMYVGQAKTETLYERVVKKHLKGNPRSSTLCFSLCAILGLPFYIDIEKSGKRKPKMDKQYWGQVTSWLMQNCYLLVKSCQNVDAEENKQIEQFTPPINLDKNPLRNSNPYIVGLSNARWNPKDNHTAAGKGCMVPIIIGIVSTLLSFLAI